MKSEAKKFRFLYGAFKLKFDSMGRLRRSIWQPNHLLDLTADQQFEFNKKQDPNFTAYKSYPAGEKLCATIKVS